MFTKVFSWLFLKKCDKCGQRKFRVVTTRRKSYRGMIVTRKCETCVIAEQMNKYDYHQRLWF